MLSRLPKRVGAGVLSAAMIFNGLYTGSMPVLAAETTDSWKQDVLTALDNLSEAQSGKDEFTQATENLQNAYDSLVGAKSVENLTVTAVTEDTITLEWSTFESEDLVGYNVYWSDSDSETAKYQLLDKDSNNLYDESGITINAADLDAAAPTVTFVVQMSTNKNHWFKVAPVTSVGAGSKSDAVMSPTAVAYETQLENINRGLTVTVTGGGAYLNWRLLGNELDGGYTETGLTGYNFNVYRDGEKIATVEDSTNYLDTGSLWSALSRVMATEAKLKAFLFSVPEKITSCMLPPLSCRALCSPKTQRTASATLLLPLPLGPTIPVIPL